MDILKKNTLKKKRTKILKDKKKNYGPAKVVYSSRMAIIRINAQEETRIKKFN
jgi:hypothetical protein